MNRIIRAFWPVFVWMAVVFVMSTDLGATSETGRILGPLLRWFNPDISTSTIEHVHFLIRKAGHVTEYAILAILVLRALRILRDTPVSHWSWSLAAWTLVAAAAYGATDEFHQTFVPSRGPSLHDVLIDTSGACLGLALTYGWTRFRHARVTADRIRG